MEKLICHLESLSQSVTNEKLFFDLKQTPKKKIYRILAQIVPYMEDDQQMLYSYFCDHSNLDIQPASLKNSVYYWMKKKVQKSYKWSTKTELQPTIIIRTFAPSIENIVLLKF